MSNTISITNPDGTNTTIDSDAFQSFWNDAREQLLEEAAAKQSFKDIVKDFADDVKIKPAVLSKYAKTRLKQEIKKLRDQVEIFEKFDEVLDGE